MTQLEDKLAAALEAAQAYVDDALQFPEQFKPGIVRKHSKMVRDALAAYDARPQAPAISQG